MKACMEKKIVKFHNALIDAACDEENEINRAALMARAEKCRQLLKKNGFLFYIEHCEIVPLY